MNSIVETKQVSRRENIDIDLTAFKVLDTAAIRSRYPAILKLFKYRISNDKRNRDALCNGCNKIIVKSKVSRLISHAKKCQGCDDTQVRQLEQSYKSLEAQRAGVKLDGKKSRPELRRLQKSYDDQVVDLLAINSLPLNLVETKEFKSIYVNVDVSYQLPTRERLNILLSARASSESMRLINKLKESDNYSVTIEMTGYSTLMAVIVTAHNGQSALLDLVDVSSDPHSSTNLAGKALSAIQGSKIPEQKFNAILSDDTSHFMLARDIIFEDFNGGRMVEFRSLAHVLNQMTGSLTKSFLLKDSLEKLLHLVEVVSKNKFIIMKLKEKGQPKSFDIIPTNKSTPIVCINWALQVKSAFQKLPRSERYNPTAWEPLVENTNFWIDLEKCRVYFDKISTTTEIASNSRLSDAFHAYLELGKFITNDNDLDTSLKDLVVEAYVTYFHQLNLDLLFTAYVLDPNKKMANLTNKAIRQAKEYITKMLATMGHKDDVTKVAINEFKRYSQNLPRTNQVEDIYSWWLNGDTIILKMVATRLAACPASAVNTKRVTSTLEQISTQEGINIASMSDILGVRIAQLSQRKKESTLEAPLLDQSVINSCVELVEDSAYFYASSTYNDFRSLVDYGSPTPIE